jgi:hypothetical protein
LSWAEKVKGEHREQEEANEAEPALLKRLIAEDVDEKPGGGSQLKPGTEKDWVVSVHDQEMRQGRKTASKRFNAHKAAVAVETDTQLISEAAVADASVNLTPGLLGVVLTLWNRSFGWNGPACAGRVG